MPKYICDNCKKEFTRKDLLTYHVNNDVCREKAFPCNVCGKNLSSRSSLYRHKKTVCVAKKDEQQNEILQKLEQMQEKQNKLEKDNEELKKQVEKLTNEKKEVHVNNNNNNTKVINNSKNINNVNKGVVINNNVTLVGYGDEDLDILSRHDIIKSLLHGRNAATKLTEVIHFNPQYPQFHNIYISNMKDKYAMKYDGEKWNM